MLPSPQDSDFEVEVVAWADGFNPRHVRHGHNYVPSIATDFVLLRSKNPFPLSESPTPVRYHRPPHDKLGTTFAQEVSLLCYNDQPNELKLQAQYPNTSLDKLQTAVQEL